jgi:hypothetical protein
VHKVSAETVNKLLGGAQAVCVWAGNTGMITRLESPANTRRSMFLTATRLGALRLGPRQI